MSDGELTAELQTFIAQYIASVEKLEILLLFVHAPEKDWSVPEIYQHVQSSIGSVNQKLSELVAEGFVSRDSNQTFRFQPKLQKMNEQVRVLSEAYRQRRIKVIEAIFSKSTEDLRKFSDAFKLRKDTE